MLIHSSNMETNVFIHESQNYTKTSKGMQEPRHFQCSSRCRLLALVTLLGILVGGMVGLFTVWMAQNVVESRFTCPQETQQSNVTYGLINTINISVETYPTVWRFRVPQNGTYLFYGKVQKNERDTAHCKDVVRLVWNRPAASGEEPRKEASFDNNSGNYVAEIVASDVQLEENSYLDLDINCHNHNTKTNVFIRVFISK